MMCENATVLFEPVTQAGGLASGFMGERDRALIDVTKGMLLATV